MIEWRYWFICDNLFVKITSFVTLMLLYFCCWWYARISRGSWYLSLFTCLCSSFVYCFYSAFWWIGPSWTMDIFVILSYNAAEVLGYINTKHLRIYWYHNWYINKTIIRVDVDIVCFDLLWRYLYKCEQEEKWFLYMCLWFNNK